MHEKEKDFKGAFIEMLMKKKVSWFEILFTAFFAVVFFYLLIFSATIKLPFISLDNTALMFIIVLLIWVVYILYLWKVLKNAKKRKKKK